MMIRTLQIVLAVLVFVLPASAFAQGGSDTIPELRLEGMPADITACVMACAGGGTPAPACTPSTTTDAERRLLAIDGQLTRIRRSVRRHETRISALEAEARRLGERTDALETRVAEQQTEIDRLGRELSSLRLYYRLVVRDYVDLAVRVGVNETKITELRSDVDALRVRVEALENRPGLVQFGGRIGGLVLHAPGDGTTYSAFMVGPRFALRLHPEHSISFDAQVLLSFDEHPFGTRTRLGYQWQFHRNAELDIGLSGTFASLNGSLDAASAFIGPDVGVTWKPLPWLNVGASLFLGTELDQGSPSFAIGGMGLVGFDLPL